MAALTEKIWNSFTEEDKNRIINSIDETLHFFGKKKYSSGIYKPFGDKPKLRQLSSGKWILTNTCVSWNLGFEFEIAIHWCVLENYKLEN